MNDLSSLERRVLDEALSQYLSLPVGSVKRSVAANLLVKVSAKPVAEVVVPQAFPSMFR